MNKTHQIMRWLKITLKNLQLLVSCKKLWKMITNSINIKF